MIANESMIEALKKSALYSEYEQSYTEATGLPIALRPVETWQLPLHGKRKENPFCALMAGKSRACAACLQMQEKLGNEARQGASIITCDYGLSEAAVPVRLGEQTVGLLQTGQVLRQKPTEAHFCRVTKRVAEQELDFEPQELRARFFQSPVVSQKKLESIVRLLAIFAEHLSIQSNQIAIQQANAEPPIITRAKRYILEHQSEDISLSQVAKAVNTSVFYFCKLFKKATGVPFTEFVSRTRIERAKNLLLNPNLRVSEIAYEVGFQSLTHFNRVFKRIAGVSPTQFRIHLPKVS